MAKERILVVDDEPELCAVLKDILSRGDRYAVETAETAEEAMHIIDTTELALVLCDYKLGGEKNGLDVLFRAKEKAPHVITILMTGFGSDQIAIRAVAEGVYDYLTKPFLSVLDVKNAVDRGMRYYLLLKKYNEKAADEELQRELLKETLEKSRRTREILRLLISKIVARDPQKSLEGKMNDRRADSHGDEEALWEKYRRDPSAENRDALIINYLWLVRYICGRLAVNLPAHIRSDELVSSGVIGLIDAIEKFDRSRDNLFRTYAYSRIRGAILDELRRLDWAPRMVRKKARELERISAGLKHELQRMPTAEEVSTAAGCSKEDVLRTYRDVMATSLLSLEEVLWQSDEQKEISRLDTIVDPGAENPRTMLLEGELKSLLTEQISRLEEKERLVLTLYYFEELTLKEIGKVLEVSESRICQLHSQAIGSIRKSIARLKKLPLDEFLLTTP